MAEKERLTKAERRAQARAERKRQEEEARKKAQRQRLVNTGATVGVLVVIAVILVPTFQRFFDGEEAAAATITQAEAAAAFDAAGCVRSVEDQPLPEPYTHYDPAEAPPADVLYTGVRPTNSGAHYSSVVGAVGGVPARQLDERGTTHNLEHGAVIVWFDPEQVDGDAQSDIDAWQQAKLDAGFDVASGGTVFASPYDGEFTEGKPIALRAWGQAVDCDRWDATVADAFVIDYWGTHGIAPERPLSPYPAGVLGYADAVVDDNTEAPTGDRHGDPEDEASEGVTDAPSEDGDEPSEDASEEDSVEPSEDATSEASDEPSEDASSS